MEIALCIKREEENYEHANALDPEEWDKVFADLDPSSVFIGGTFALMPVLDLEDYKEQKTSETVSILFIVNCTGCDKRELLVFGKQNLNLVASIPLKYYQCSNPKVTMHAIEEYLIKFNNNLAAEGKKIKLLLQEPADITEKVILSNIEIIKSSLVVSAIEHIVKCFKYHYRKNQILKRVVYGANTKNTELVDYLNMISAAWHNISEQYIEHLFFPQKANLINDENEAKQSLSYWCNKYNIPVSETNPSFLDNFINVDNDLQSLEVENDQKQTEETKFSKCTSTSEIEAYQAMKRLVSYLQGENADPKTVHSAKVLEDHLECGAISEIHNFFMDPI